MSNCDVYADVDFGHGPVEIRCTERGKHTDHKCEVVIKSEKIPGENSPKGMNVHHSVFDDGVEPGNLGVKSIRRPR